MSLIGSLCNLHDAHKKKIIGSKFLLPLQDLKCSLKIKLFLVLFWVLKWYSTFLSTS